MNTPWGRSDSIERIQRGVSWVGTPSHGGLAVAKGVAEKLLSPEALKVAEAWADYYFFEEDCDYTVAFYEQPEWFRVCERAADRKEEPRPFQFLDDAGVRAHFLPTISGWNADYLLARGITPEPEAYARYLLHKEDQKLRAEKSPELIVAAWGEWADWVPAGKVGIVTAAGTKFLVDAESYSKKGYRMAAYPEAVPLAA